MRAVALNASSISLSNDKYISLEINTNLPMSSKSGLGPRNKDDERDNNLLLEERQQIGKSKVD